MLDKLDTERVGLKPLKPRIRAIAALPIIAKARASIGLQADARSSTASARRQKSPLSITVKTPWLNRTSLVEVNPMAFIVEQAAARLPPDVSAFSICSRRRCISVFR